MQNMKRVMMVSMIATAALLSACAATREARSVDVSGFLNEYRSELRPGDKSKDEILSRYMKPNLNIKLYKKMMLAPVTVWDDPAHPLTAEQRNDYLTLADSFHEVLYEKLSKDFEMTDKFGPETIRFQVAITHGDKSKIGLAFISKVVPQARALNTIWGFASGKPAFTGDVSVEFKATDAETGELLFAGADKRVGTLKLFDKSTVSSWGDVQNAFTYWADLAVYRICQLQDDANCEKPKA